MTPSVAHTIGRWKASLGACKFACEGIVSKRRTSPYRSGRVRTWIKTKNPNSPAMARVWEG